MYNIPFQTIDWKNITSEINKGEQGQSISKSIVVDGLRVRMVEYSANYVADHWCERGHIVHCLEGGFKSAMHDGSTVDMKQGMTYVVSNKKSIHKSISDQGAKLLIIDGDFLSMD